MSGLFNLINIPFSYVIRFFYSLTNNYMLALLGFAVVVKIVLFPLGIKQQKNMVKQAALRPREMAIRAKYAGRTDKATQQKCQQEVMELYQAENYNVMSGCLPMIVQLIVILAIYQIVYGPLTYLCSMSADGLAALKQAVVSLQNPDTAIEELKAFVGNEIQLLSQIKEFGISTVLDTMKSIGTASAEAFAEVETILTGKLPNMTVFGGALDLSRTPTVAFNALLAIPVLNLVTTWGSTKLTRKFSYQAPNQEQQDSSMKIMEYGMPLMIFYMAFRLPAALGAYWIFQNLLGVLQQFLLSKIYPYPTFTEEEMKAAEREYAGKKSKPAKNASGGGKTSGDGKPVRSLHHIDDDDYETAPASPAKKGQNHQKKQAEDTEAETLSEENSANETKDEEGGSASNRGIDKAPLKK